MARKVGKLTIESPKPQIKLPFPGQMPLIQRITDIYRHIFDLLKKIFENMENRVPNSFIYHTSSGSPVITSMLNVKTW